MMERIGTPEELEKRRQSVLSSRAPERPRVSVCAGTGCRAMGAQRVVAAFESELDKLGLRGDVEVRATGCHGYCEKGPIVLVAPEETCYLQTTPGDVPEIVSTTLKDKKVVERLLYADPATGARATTETEIPFYRDQQRLVLGANRHIAPTSIDDYLAIGGYRALAKALFEMTPDAVIAEVKDAKLRGRGGGGFPTGLKWEAARNSPGEPKYVVVNGDEGDPGSYMDKSLMEGNPFRVLEGLTIGAYAIGAREGYVYLRREYALAVEHLTSAIGRARELGLLGKNILGSGLDFDVKVHQGAGAFVCGEETALLLTLEGKVGEPRIKPPYPTTGGLWGKPTNINNVETWATVPVLIDEGARAFGAIGTEGSKGTKIFSLVGKIANRGLAEVPMGVTLRDLVYKIGGGIPGGKKLKAVQTGGPSGGCIPERLLDVRVDYEELAAAGSMIGSGWMVVLDEDDCMVEAARYFTEFLAEESCGKCTPCRGGLRQMLKILTRITRGEGRDGDLELLLELEEVAREASLCALGKTGPNAFSSTLRYFRHEYEAHIKEKRCPALACKKLTSFYIEPADCKACMICLRQCPNSAVLGGKDIIHAIDPERCDLCGTCFDVCPPRFQAVKKISGVPIPPPLPEEQRILVRKSKTA
jgi:NADH-quinone oxidoreductase subunit F